MSIISDALKKASVDRRGALSRDSIPRENLSDEIRKISARRIRWNISSTLGTVFIVSFAAVLFLYNVEHFYPPRVQTRPADLPVIKPDITPGGITGVVIKEGPPIKIASFKKEAPKDSYLFVLNGIMKGAGEPLAIVNNKVVEAGDYVNGAKVAKITDNGVILIYRNKEVVLKIE